MNPVTGYPIEFPPLPVVNPLTLKKEIDKVKETIASMPSSESVTPLVPDPPFPTPYGSFEDYLAFD